MDELIGQAVNGYTVIEEAGHGGMATVYRARSAEGTDVALKILSPIVAKERRFRTRFAREIAILRDLKHPNIVPILDHGQLDNRPYIVMPFAEHGTLQEVLGNGAFGPRRSARIVSGIAGALSHAHSKGIIHRDVKPSNILLDENGDALLSDFGFAHLHDSNLSLTGSLIIGTPAYMSPEQCQGEKVDSKSDQYSLGIIIFQLSTGKLPYEAETPMGLIVKQINTPLPRPRYINANVPDAIEDVLIKSLDKEPNNRYPNVDDLNEAFQDAMLRSFDASTGRLRPEAISDKPITKVVQKKDVLEAVESRRSKLLRRALPALLLLAIPLSAWAASSFIGSNSGAANLQATIDSLATQNAEILGFGAGDDEISTSVAGTLAVMALSVNDEGAASTPTPVPGIAEEAGEGDEVVPPLTDHTPTFVPTYAPTSTGAPHEPTDEPEPTVVDAPTKTIEPTATLMFTETVVPSNTQEATATPKCKGAEHPQFPCTPTPTLTLEI
jgi:serine/threonine protein kinase